MKYSLQTCRRGEEREGEREGGKDIGREGERGREGCMEGGREGGRGDKVCQQNSLHTGPYAGALY